MQNKTLSKVDLIRNELDLEYKQSIILKYTLLLGLREKIPPSIRNRVGFSFEKLKNPKRDFPIDRKVQTLEYEAMKKNVSEKKYHLMIKPWTTFSACFTHDVDTLYDLKEGISILRKIEKKHDIKSTWNFVPESKEYKIDKELLKSLERDGHEIASHSLKHDGKFAFLSKHERRLRVRKSKEVFKKMGFNINGFRAPWLHRTRDLILFLEENKYLWDSSFPDTDNTTIGYRGTGCSTVFPFQPLIKENKGYRKSSIIELPITVPQDWSLIHPMKLSNEKILSLWIEKIDYIEDVGGLALFLTHPAKYDIGNNERSWIYDDIIKYIKNKKPFIGRCIDVAERWKATNDIQYNLDIKKMNLHMKSERRIKNLAFYIFSPKNEKLKSNDCELLKSDIFFNKKRSLFLVKSLDREMNMHFH
ncbi:MAG: polysaccharide deacetylase family protein [Nanoarchaeota archaeon]